MKSLLEFWEQLRGHAGAADAGYRLSLVQSSEHYRAFAAIELATDSPALVVELDSRVGQKFLKSISTDAFTARFAQFPGLTSGRSAIAIALSAPAFSDLFVHLCTDVLAAAREATTAQALPRNIAVCIDRWRRFVGRTSYGLTAEEERGLFGELALLLAAVRHRGATCAIDAWKGPNGGVRDFEFDDCTAEVKTCAAEGSHVIRVLSPEQLEPIAGRSCFLAVFTLKESETDGCTLPEMVAKVRSAIETQHCDTEGLLTKLAAYGYIGAQADRYTNRYAITSSLLHEIGPGFPRIKTADVPGGVTNVNFSIVLETLAGYVVDPADAFGELRTDERNRDAG